MPSIIRVRRRALALLAGTLLVAFSAAPALACGGLIGPNGAVNLLRTTTFAGYHDGEEHYVTAFEFAGGGGSFGSLTPLPGIPTSVEKGGDWTLQRLRQETEPSELASFAAAPSPQRPVTAEVLMEVTIDALDLTVLRGGADEVGRWATEHGFRLPPDAPEVLEFYAARTQIFMAAAFDGDAAAERGQQVGDGTAVHITIPTDNPWVPLRILGLGKTGQEIVEADVYLLTDRAPTLLPVPDGFNGMALDHSRPRLEGAPRRPALRPRDGVGAIERLADQGGDRRQGAGAQVRPGHRCDRWRRAVPGRCRAGPAGRRRPDGRRGHPDRAGDDVHRRRRRRHPAARPLPADGRAARPDARQ